MTNRIVYQGESGAYSHLACQTYYPDLEPIACTSFSSAFSRVRNGEAELAMIPVENTLAGRVSDIYHLLPEGGLRIIAEEYLPIHHQLLGLKGAKLSDIKAVRSHPMALGQVRKRLETLGIDAIADADTAGAARRVVDRDDKTIGAIASRLAADIYGLDIIAEDVEDAAHNTTRFLVLSKEGSDAPNDGRPVVTSFVFKVRSVPSALYKALGGFATNGINMTKLESYMVNGSFTAAQFYADVEGHPEDENMKLALDELNYFSEKITMLGTYPAHTARSQSR